MAAIELFNTPLFTSASLKAYYRLEGNSNDAKGSHNGSDTNITYNASYGKFGQGASFNDASSVISITDSSDFKPTSGSYTFGCWMYPTGDGNLFQSYADSGGTASGIEVISIGTGYTINHANNGSIVSLSQSGTPITASTWNLLVVAYDGTTLYVYVNGVLNNSGALANPSYLATSYVELGRRNNGGSQTNYYGGYMDDVFFYNGYMWTATDVSNYYNGNWSNFLPFL